jgi:hypothetical protein
MNKLGMATVLAASVLLVACNTTPTPTDEVSHDGLTRIEKAGFDQVWVKRGTDLSPYKRIKLEGVGIEYRPAKCVRNAMQASSQQEFCLDDRQKQRLVDIIRESFRSELAKSTRFTLTDDVGPDVLLIRGALLDVVSYVPPEPIGRGDIFLNAVGEATLIFEIRDSSSNAILARVADRRAAERAGDMPQRSNRVTNSFEVERAARAWASILRQRLDNVATTGQTG